MEFQDLVGKLTLCTIVMAGFAGVTSAQPIAEMDGARERMDLRKQAEELERREQYTACAHAYMKVYEGDREASGADRDLYNAGVCYEDAQLVDRAIDVYALLETQFPHSRVIQKALVRRASAAASIARFEEAAKVYERYANRFASERDALPALSNAIYYYQALGRDREAIAGIETFVKRYGKKQPSASASALLSLASIYEKQGKPKRTIKTYKRYLKVFGQKGGLENRLIVHAKLGELLWKQSCPSADSTGSCLRLRPTSPVGQSCAPKSHGGFAIVRRHAGKAIEAHAHFAKSLHQGRRSDLNRFGDEKKSATDQWLAAASFYMLEEDFENFLAREFPRNLHLASDDEDTRRQSEAVFAQWYIKTSKRLQHLVDSYERVRSTRGNGAQWAIASALRIGQVSEHFSNMLLAGKIPKVLRGTEKVDPYCRTLSSHAVPLEDLAVSAFSFCLNLATELNWSNHSSRLCETKRIALRPEIFPAGSELHGTSDAPGYDAATEALATGGAK